MPIPNLAEIGAVKLRPTNSVKVSASKAMADPAGEPPWDVGHIGSTLRNRPPPQIPLQGEGHSSAPKPRLPYARSFDAEPDTATPKDQRRIPKLPPSRNNRPPPPVPNLSSNDAGDQTEGHRGSSTGAPLPRHRNLPPTPIQNDHFDDQHNGEVRSPVLANRQLPPVPGEVNNTGHSTITRPKPPMAPKPNLAPKPRLPSKPKLPPR